MKIALTAAQPSLDAPVDPRFGRCPYFLIVETDDLALEAVENSSAMAEGGAGIQAAQRIAEMGATVLLTGNCGPNAFRTLSAAGVQVVVGCSGTVRDVIQQFQAGQLRPAEQPNVASHFGTVGGADRDEAPSTPEGVSQATDDPWGGRPGRGMGLGRGAGRGRGMGRRGGGGRGRGKGR